VFLVDSGGEAFVDSHMPRLMPFLPPEQGWKGDGFLWRAGSGRANSFAAGLAEEAKRKAEQEYRRLLYVGMTRAEDRLIVCGYHGKRGQPEAGWHALVRDGLAASPHTSQVRNPATGETVLRYQVTKPGAVVPAQVVAGQPASPNPPPAALFEPLPPGPLLPRPLSPSGAGATVERGAEVMPGARSPVLDSSAVQSFALERGLAVHRLLQVLPAIPAGERADAASR